MIYRAFEACEIPSRFRDEALFSSAWSAGRQLVGRSVNGILIPQLRLSDSAARAAVSLRFPTSGRINVRRVDQVREFGRVSMEVSINGAAPRTVTRLQIDLAVTLSRACLTRVQLSAKLTANLSRARLVKLSCPTRFGGDIWLPDWFRKVTGEDATARLCFEDY